MLLLLGRRDKPQRASLQSSLRLAEAWVRPEWMVGRVESEELSFLNLWKETVWGPCLELAYLFQKRIWKAEQREHPHMGIVFIGTAEVLLVLWDDGGLTWAVRCTLAVQQRMHHCGLSWQLLSEPLNTECLSGPPLPAGFTPQVVLSFLASIGPHLFFCCWQWEKVSLWKINIWFRLNFKSTW